MTTNTTDKTPPAAEKNDKSEPSIEIKEEAAEPAPQAKEEPAAAPPKPEAKKDETISRIGRADAIIRRNVLWALGAGVVPLPLLDIVAISGVQLKMLAELSELYKLPFQEEIARKLVSSLFSSVVGVKAGVILGASIAKFLPTVGTAVGVVAVPLLGGAFTMATGKVFVMHFESGGTLLDFDPYAMRAYFKREFEKAKAAVAEVQTEAQGGSRKTP